MHGARVPSLIGLEWGLEKSSLLAAEDARAKLPRGTCSISHLFIFVMIRFMLHHVAYVWNFFRMCYGSSTVSQVQIGTGCIGDVLIHCMLAGGTD